MKPIDRVCKALYHEEPDIVPDDGDIAGVASVLETKTIKAGTGFRVWKSAFGSVHLDYVNPSTGSSSKVFDVGWVSPEYFIWWYTIAPAVRWPDDLERIEPPKLDLDRIASIKRDIEELHGKGYFVITSHHGIFDSPWRYLRGLEQWMMDIVRSTAFARRLIEFAAKSHMEIANAIIEETGVDAVMIIGDLGTPEGPFISPSRYRELIYPWHRRLADAYHKRGAFFFIHSNGYLMPIMEDMVNAGFDAINPISPLDGMNLAEMKEKYGDKVTLYAELSQEMYSWRKADTERYSQALFGPDLRPRIEALAYTVKTAAPGGGFIFASASHWGSATTECYRSFKEAWQDLRRYPTRP
jgi:uroporphyrinogen decarboxylase